MSNGFHDLLNLLKEPGDQEVPAGIYDDLSSEYAKAQTLVEGSTTKVEQLQSELQAREAEISRLKSQNYDLVMSSGVNIGGDDSNKNDDGEGQETLTGIDSLFS